MRKKPCFEIGQLRNMVEVPLTFDVPSNKTVDVKGAKTIMINNHNPYFYVSFVDTHFVP